MAETINILANGLHGLLTSINYLVPIWQGTAQALDNSAQAVSQLAAATQPQIHVTISPPTHALAPIIVPLPDQFKGLKEKADPFIRACNEYFIRVRITDDGEKVSTALALIKGDTASTWAETQLVAR
jgi:hypothetical protein